MSNIRILNLANQLQRVVLSCFFLIFLTQCQSVPKQTVKKKIAQKPIATHFGKWEGSLRIKNFKEGKSYLVIADFIAKKPSRLRAEITSTVGIHLASLALGSRKMKFLISREKNFYVSSASARAMKSIIGVPLRPKLLLNVLFDEPFETKDWSCTLSKGTVSECFHLPSETKVEWKKRRGQRKQVVIKSKQFQIILNLRKNKMKVEPKSEIFTLRKPKSFKKIVLR